MCGYSGSPPTTTTTAPATESTERRDLNERTPMNETFDPVAVLTCAIQVGQNVTQEFNLTVVWDFFEPTLTEHLANLTNCSSAGDNDAVQACLRAESLAANATYFDFVATVNEVGFNR